MTRNTRYYDGKPCAFCTLHAGEGTLKRAGTKIVTAMEMHYPTTLHQEVALGRMAPDAVSLQGVTVLARTDHAPPIEDFPDTSDYSLIASSKALEVLRREAGDDIEALRVQLEFAGHQLHEAYWMVLATKTIPCVDLGASERFIVSRQPLFRLKVVIDPMQLPTSVGIFRVPEYAQTIFRGSLVEALLDAGCTGFTAQEVPCINHAGLE